MGTRHLIAVQKNNELRVAQYGQWDGYPRVQGSTALAFLHSWDRPAFEARIDAVRDITEAELKAAYLSVGGTEDGAFTLEAHQRFTERYPQLSRDTGAKVLQCIADAPPGLALRRDLAFAQTSLFCEWAYVVDLDNNKFEVYRGFNKEPLQPGERFYAVQQSNPAPHSGYYPVRKVAEFDLDCLPSRDEFLSRVPLDD